MYAFAASDTNGEAPNREKLRAAVEVYLSAATVVAVVSNAGWIFGCVWAAVQFALRSSMWRAVSLGVSVGLVLKTPSVWMACWVVGVIACVVVGVRMDAATAGGAPT